MSTVYSLRTKIYYFSSTLIAAIEVSIIYYLGEFGLSNLSTCFIKQNSRGKYLLSIIYCVNVPMLWVTVFIVLKNPVSRNNKQIRQLVLVAAAKTITWGIPSLCIIVPTYEIFDYIALLIGCLSGISVFFSRLGFKHIFKVIKHAFVRIKNYSLTRTSRRLEPYSLIVNEYIKEELSIGDMLENITKNTVRSIIISISLVFLKELRPPSIESYAYVKKKYEFDVDDLSKLKNAIGQDILTEEDKNYKIWEYEPDVFSNIRQEYGWTNSKIATAFINRENFRDLQNENISGKSGGFIFRTHNAEIITKTITKQEKYLLLEILQKYQERMINHRESKIIRILGLYKIRSTKQSFILMENILKHEEKPLAFDLKGSICGRYVAVTENVHEIMLKDQNIIQMNKKVKLDASKREEVLKALEDDSKFLQDLDIIDYSLIIGFYSRKMLVKDSYGLQGNEECSYSLGIIDFLQQYTVSRKLEVIYKHIICKKNFSMCPPDKYAERFMEFISSIFQFV